MSRFRPEPILVGIERDRWVFLRRGRQPQSLCVAADPGADHGRIAETLARPEWRGGRARIIVSDRLVGYAVLERPQGLAGAGELMQTIRSRSAELFGDRHEWTILADPQPMARHDLACGLPSPWLESLRQVFAAGDIAIESIRPHLVACCNRWRREIGGGTVLFVVLETDSVAIALIAAGEFRGVRVLPRGGGEPLSTQLSRARLLFDESVTRCLVVAAPDESTSADAAFELHRLAAVAPGESRENLLALAGSWS